MNYNDLFTYNPETGELIWKARPIEHFPKGRWGPEMVRKMWNTKYAGKPVGFKGRTRRGGQPQSPQINIFGKLVYLHRIVWELNAGPIPDGMLVDHKDGNPLNNRMGNLRLATLSENARNCRMRKHGHGVKGVTKSARCKSWIAQITVDKKNILLGSYPTKGLAAIAYAKAAIRYHGAFARIQ